MKRWRRSGDVVKRSRRRRLSDDHAKDGESEGAHGSHVGDSGTTVLGSAGGGLGAGGRSLGLLSSLRGGSGGGADAHRDIGAGAARGDDDDGARVDGHLDRRDRGAGLLGRRSGRGRDLNVGERGVERLNG